MKLTWLGDPSCSLGVLVYRAAFLVALKSGVVLKATLAHARDVKNMLRVCTRVGRPTGLAFGVLVVFASQLYTKTAIELAAEVANEGAIAGFTIELLEVLKGNIEALELAHQGKRRGLALKSMGLFFVKAVVAKDANFQRFLEVIRKVTEFLDNTAPPSWSSVLAEVKKLTKIGNYNGWRIVRMINCVRKADNKEMMALEESGWRSMASMGSGPAAAFTQLAVTSLEGTHVMLVADTSGTAHSFAQSLFRICLALLTSLRDL